MTKEQIMTVLEVYKRDIEARGLTVYAIALKGSQNYNLEDEESDIDANLVFIPTLQQLRTNEKFKFEYPTGDVVCHNIYAFADIVAKGNPQWVEVCNSDYIIGDLSLFEHYELNPSALKGMIMEKVHAFKKLYPSRAKYVKEFGYDPKQLHHIIRLYDILSKEVKVYKYTDEEKQQMMDIKRGRFPSSVEEADKLRDEYISALNAIYESRKLKYEPQPVDTELLDHIVMSYYVKELSNLTKPDTAHLAVRSPK